MKNSDNIEAVYDKDAMFLRALAAFLVLPGVVGFLLPPVLGSLDPWRVGWMAPGAIVMIAGTMILIWCVRDFYVSGKGTLAPWDPPKSLVTVGLYRYTRNPMYVGVLALVIGWAVLLGSPMVSAYAVILAIGIHLRVLLKEEPWLRSQFGPSWDDYAREVNRWLPTVPGYARSENRK